MRILIFTFLLSYSQLAWLHAYTPADLATRSDAIVIGTVGPRTTIKDKKNRRVVTRIEITDPKMILDDRNNTEKDDTFVLTQRGGTLGKVKSTIRGDANLLQGSRVMLFLFREKPGGDHYLVELSVGAFVIADDSLVQNIAESMIDTDMNTLAPQTRRFSLDESLKAIEGVLDEKKESKAPAKAATDP